MIILCFSHENVLYYLLEDINKIKDGKTDSETVHNIAQSTKSASTTEVLNQSSTENLTNKPVEDVGGFRCSRCTYENRGSFIRNCEMCGAPVCL